MKRFLSTLLLAASFAMAQAPELGQGWLPEFNLASRQLLSLAEAIPAEKYAWRPAEGVRSVSEVYMHIALGNFWLMDRAGIKLPDDSAKPAWDLEKKVTGKAEVIGWLKKSQDAVRQYYPKADLKMKLKFFDKDTTADGVLLRLLVHNHEHMGQAVAYARMMGVAPPWSK